MLGLFDVASQKGWLLIAGCALLMMLGACYVLRRSMMRRASFTRRRRAEARWHLVAASLPLPLDVLHRLPVHQAMLAKLFVRPTKDGHRAGDAGRLHAGFLQGSFVDADIVAGDIERSDAVLVHAGEERREIAKVILPAAGGP